jgi:hypothetical protein
MFWHSVFFFIAACKGRKISMDLLFLENDLIKDDKFYLLMIS